MAAIVEVSRNADKWRFVSNLLGILFLVDVLFWVHTKGGMHMKTNTSMHQTNKRFRGKRGNAGFTLVELIVVIVIMGILTAAILPTVTGYVADARKKVEESNMHMVEQAAHLYLTNCEMEQGGSDSLTITAADLVNEGYLSALPEGENYTVTITKAENGRHYNVEVAASQVSGSEGEEGQQG